MEKRIGEPAGVGQGVLKGLNLRPEEVERTLLMFAVYTFSSIGLIWLELSTVGLFIDQYGADKLPWIYIASAGIGSSLGVVYSRLQSLLPLRRAIIAILLLMAVPLFLFRFGLGIKDIKILGLSLQFLTLFVMWLWVEACYLLNDLNTSITSNQLFNIREIKRTYPIISSGYLVAGVISGFSLPLLLKFVGLNNVTLVSGAMVLVGAAILFYLSQRYEQSFPDSSRWTPEDELPEFSTRSLKGPLQGYVIPLVMFFVMAEVLYVMVDFQFFTQLEYRSDMSGGASGIVSFLGLFEGVLSTFQVATQWFASSRLVEKLGVFGTASVLPAAVVGLGLFSLFGGITGLFTVFVGFFILRFLDELFHYTLIETTGTVLFQPLPENIRSDIQTLVNGVFEPLSTGLSGVGILLLLWITYVLLPDVPREIFQRNQSLIFVATVILLAVVWLWVVWKIRSQYVRLLVRSAERGRLGTTDIDMKSLKRSVVDELKQPTPEADKRSCIELLSQLDPKNVGDTLVPLLEILSPNLQRQALELMLYYPNPAHLEAIRSLSRIPLPPEVLALALRYIWLTESSPDINQLKPYLQPNVDPVVRGTAAALIMRRGDREQKAAATNTIRRMIVSSQERERVMGVRALGDADYLQGLRLYLNDLLADESLRVRCSVLEVIAATQMEEYYGSLLKAISYRSTRDAARQALVRLGNDAIPLLTQIATDIYKSDLVRLQAWTALGEIGTPEALDALIDNLLISWRTTRRNILRILLKTPNDVGIERTLDRIGRNGVETLIEQELMFIGQLYSALVDLEPNDLILENSEAFVTNPSSLQMLCRSLRNLEYDAVERCFLLMKFLYSLGSIQAAAFNIRSQQMGNIARGLEILDNTVDIVHKRSLIGVLDNHSITQKLYDLSPLISYKPMEPSDRLRRLLEFRHFLSDWSLACCFHQAREAHWSLTAEQALMCLRHPTGFVREAVLAYLKVGARQALVELLPMLQTDRDPLVAHQVEQLMSELAIHRKTETQS